MREVLNSYIRLLIEVVVFESKLASETARADRAVAETRRVMDERISPFLLPTLFEIWQVAMTKESQTAAEEFLKKELGGRLWKKIWENFLWAYQKAHPSTSKEAL